MKKYPKRTLLLSLSFILVSFSSLLLGYSQKIYSVGQSYEVKVVHGTAPVGVVTGSGINCGSNCTESYTSGTTVTLTTTVPADKRFVDWGTTCVGENTSTTCEFEVTGGKYLYPRYAYEQVNIKVSKKGTGSGTVSGTGLNCGSDCTMALTTSSDPSSFQTAKLSASPAADSVFVGWDTSGSVCYSGGGKGDPPKINPSSSCTAIISKYVKTSTAVPIFNKKAISNEALTDDNESEDSDKEEAPASPKIDTTVVNGQEVSKGQAVTVSQDKPLTISGKTVPGGIVKLFIFSEPKTATVTADKNGNWSYDITGLPPGSHHVEAEVTNPKTKLTSKRANLLAFTVQAAGLSPASAAVDTPIDRAVTKPSMWFFLGGLVAAVLGFAYITWRLIRSRRPRPPLAK